MLTYVELLPVEGVVHQLHRCHRQEGCHEGVCEIRHEVPTAFVTDVTQFAVLQCEENVQAVHQHH